MDFLRRQNADDCLRLREIINAVIHSPLGKTEDAAFSAARDVVDGKISQGTLNVNDYTQFNQCFQQIWNSNNQGGARKSSGASHVRFHGAKRKVHLDGRKKYIKFNGTVVYLKDIRGKYCAV